MEVEPDFTPYQLTFHDEIESQRQTLTQEYFDILKEEGRNLHSMRQLRIAVYERDMYECLKCGSKTNLTLDHIIPRCRKGRTKYDNLQTLCSPCNGKKGKGTEDYRREQF
jgi:5-methylcytosine-specific restriction endonuclease McrA